MTDSFFAIDAEAMGYEDYYRDLTYDLELDLRTGMHAVQDMIHTDMAWDEHQLELDGQG